MKSWILILVTACWFASCSLNFNEPPLTLLPGAEPSAKSRNDLGIQHYQNRKYLDALLQFNQANFADPTSGEIHFNLGLAYLQENRREKAKKHFRQARILARGNPEILRSSILNKLLQEVD
jgi:Flp pilus assembly protein TadD